MAFEVLTPDVVSMHNCGAKFFWDSMQSNYIIDVILLENKNSFQMFTSQIEVEVGRSVKVKVSQWDGSAYCRLHCVTMRMMRMTQPTISQHCR